MLEAPHYREQVQSIAGAIVRALRDGKKVLWCGNGGSAAEAQHMAAELSGRFLRERPGLYSEALSVNSSTLTCIGNDYGYDRVFARQVE
ncbi:MAG: SIS domain-containing protein, partial [Candidatus Eremiobacteraeota bacterium]|nr:SIS domain-containing protein [Candidatus Eremiobacteraeota bacterium]